MAGGEQLNIIAVFHARAAGVENQATAKEE